MFDRQGFIKAAKEEGYSDEIINQVLVDQGAQPVSRAEGIAGMLPTAGGWAGALVGTPFGMGMPGGTAGQMLGYGAGESLKRLLGQGYEPSMGKIMGTALTQQAPSGFAKGMATQIPYTLLTSLLHPLGTLGRLREKSLGETPTDVSSLKEESLANLAKNKQYMYGTPELQQMSRQRLSQFLQTNVPLETAGQGAGMRVQEPQQVPINTVYQGLTPFERTGGAYERTSLVPQATKLASESVRGYLTNEIPSSTRLINQLYGSAAKLEPYRMKILGGLGASIPIYIAGRMLYDLLRNATGGEQ